MLHIWGYGVIFLLRKRKSIGKTQSLHHPRLYFSMFFCIYRDFLLYISLVFMLFSYKHNTSYIG